MSPRFTLFALGLVTTVFAPPTATAQRTCGCPLHNPALGARLDVPTDCDFGSTNPSNQYDVTSIYRIPVVFHVLMHSDGRGNLSNATVQEQIDILNEDFRALAGTLGAPGYDTGIEFYLATTDPSGQPTNGILRSTDNRAFRDRGDYWLMRSWDTNRYLNLYSNSAGGFLGYVPDIPQGGIVGQSNDRVVVAWDTIGRNGPAGPPFNLGRTATHEVGHYLGLIHTFSGGCGSGSCYTSGDLICDTNAEAQPHSGCSTSASSCGSPDPIHNYMNYSDDACMNQFTREQTLRMRCTLEFWRTQLWTRCDLAAVTNRNAGTNPQSLTTSPMVLGGVFTAQVDVTTTSHTTGQLFGAVSPTSLPLFNGYTLLADIGAAPGNILPLPSSPGPIAQTGFNLPIDFSLCGVTIYTQAIQFGGAPGFALSNAQDCTIGLQ